MSTGKTKGRSDIHRLTLRMSEDNYQKLQYWADRAECSLNDFVLVLLERYIDIENGNYELPTLEVARLNQIIDGMASLSQNMGSLESVVISGFDSLLSLTRGTNYLLEQEDGEIGI